MSDPMQVDKKLYELEGWKLIAVCAAYSERMFPNFALFSRLVGFGDAAKLRLVLDGVWDNLANNGAKMNFEVQLDNVEDNMPDLEEYTMYGASPALDAVVALFQTVNCVLEQDKGDGVALAQLSRECVATFVEVTECDDQMSDEEVVRLINTHDLMVNEDDFQQEVLTMLLEQEKADKAFIAELRELSHNEGYSNIGITDDEDA